MCALLTSLTRLYLFQVIVSILTIIPSDLSTLIDFYSFCIWLGYGVTMAALLVLRYTEPKLPRPYKVSCNEHK